MKKAILIFFVILCSNSNLLAQKKKIKKSSSTSSTFLAKAENATAELINSNLYLIETGAGVQNDSVKLKSFSNGSKPNAVKITPFSTKGKKLFLVSWTENVLSTTNLKTENALIVFSEIVNFETKSKVLSNTQSTINITEIHYLDAKQTVSETLQKVRKEGFELVLNQDGDVSLKNKTQENKLTYKADKNAFVPKK